jgi:hypothetical protein
MKTTVLVLVTSGLLLAAQQVTKAADGAPMPTLFANSVTSAPATAMQPVAFNYDWRYRWYGNRWWYWTPQNNWVYWYGNAWVPYYSYGYTYPSYGYGYTYPYRYYTGYRGPYDRPYGYYGRGYYGRPWYGYGYGRRWRW